MKKITLSLAFIAGMTMMISCGGGATEEVKAEAQVEEATTDPVVEEAPIAEEAPVSEVTMDLTEGKALYEAKCQACHQVNGEGLAGAFPPLAKSDYLADKTAAIRATILGLTGELTVNGTVFNSVMAPVPMSDEELLSVMNYVYNSWGNEGEITAHDIEIARK